MPGVIFVKTNHSLLTIPALLGRRLLAHRPAIRSLIVKGMATTDLSPPPTVRGMRTLDLSLFNKTVKVPCLLVNQGCLQAALKLIKPFLLKMDHVKPVQEIEDTKAKAVDGSSTGQHKKVLLDSRLAPRAFDDIQPDIRKGLEELGVHGFGEVEVALTYQNWKCDELLSAVLPEDMEKATSYSRIGHIVHLNLREHLAEYRFLIGDVLLDKLKGVATVVNKTDAIGNEFRNFQMEVLAGDPERMVTTVKENGCVFEFDFSRVFWNPRLCTEHERLVDKLARCSVLYDVFAGVGPFAIPAARTKRCAVLANDLNPGSHEWLLRNVKLNRVTDRVAAYNLDGREFLRTVVAEDVARRWLEYNRERSKFGQDDEDVSVTPPNLNVVMNLPALAVQFLDAFRGMFTALPSDNQKFSIDPQHVEKEIAVHCYSFAREHDYKESVPSQVESVLGCRLDRSTTETFYVRSVAPNKEMIRISFLLPTHVLFEDKDISHGNGSSELECTGPPSKKLCIKTDV